MHIPLDYYRILGLPIQATTEQLRQAHRDRTLQLPRREYSDTAIASRKQLIDEAYVVLSHSDKRQAYDANFLARTYELTPEIDPSGFTASDPTLLQPSNAEAGSDSHTPSIEIQDEQLVGALLILQELGEYELVLKLGRPFLTGGKANLSDGRHGDPSIVFPDIVLTVALACLELGREQWQQGQYENAAEALDTGRQLLLREGLFVGVRGEIQADLYKLRPYRVLELLALPESHTEERLRGLQLLQDMLHERGGIDGAGNDQSGLNIDDFLKFIQQLRSYLTVAEQQVLFEQEARRPSAVATYLAIYALLARGFSDRQPALVQRAKQLLLRLSGRQDVYLEQAVCTLLLGQTEEASQALELSQEYEPIAFIREHSQGSPDLLPGLCLYSEQWLQDEVFPHFRDLLNKRASLKDYFADRQVQSYLEQLPTETDEDWALAQPQETVEAAPVRSLNSPVNFDRRNVRSAHPAFAGNGYSSNLSEGRPRSAEQPSNASLIETARARIAARTGTATLSSDNRPMAPVATMPAAERVPQTSAQATLTPPARLGTERTRSREPERPQGSEGGKRPSPPATSDNLSAEKLLHRGAHRSSRFAKSNWVRWLLPALLLLGVVTTGFVLAWILSKVQSSPKQSDRAEPMAQVDRPSTTSSPQPSPSATASPTTELDKPAAEAVLESWLTAKSAAMGPKYEATALEQVLADPKLTEWQRASQEAKRDNWYKQYKHEVQVTSVELSKDKPNQAKVLATVSEATDYYAGGKLEDSSTDNLKVQYILVQQDDTWLIQDWDVLP